MIVLEDDLEVAVDFFDYMSAMQPLLDADDTLLAASSYNDLGQAGLVRDPRQVLRSDFFPGLGWMLSARVWRTDLGEKWPDSFWDDWLREPPQRKGRQVLRPEVRGARAREEIGPIFSSAPLSFCTETPPAFTLYTHTPTHTHLLGRHRAGVSHHYLWRERRVAVAVLLCVSGHGAAQWRGRGLGG